MLPLFAIVAVMIVGGLVIESFVSSIGRESGLEIKEKPTYEYTRKKFLLTRAEHECYDAIVRAVGEEYIVFVQVHLSAFLDHKVYGQHWNYAFGHVNQKSVDFVLCDKSYISPKLVIELDDRSHELPQRKERDREVERILKNAKMPLLRLENHGRFDSQEIDDKIRQRLNQN